MAEKAFEVLNGKNFIHYISFDRAPFSLFKNLQTQYLCFKHDWIYIVAYIVNVVDLLLIL